jgi:glc operon protein GlcG
MDLFRATKYITLDGAKKMMAAAEAEARKNNWNVAIAIVDAAGNLLMFQKLDETQIGSVDIAIGKARTAVAMKRPTKALEEIIAGGRTVFLAVEKLTPLQGGLPAGFAGGFGRSDEGVACTVVGSPVLCSRIW